jgi:hypothetical protein
LFRKAANTLSRHGGHDEFSDDQARQAMQMRLAASIAGTVSISIVMTEGSSVIGVHQHGGTRVASSPDRPAFARGSPTPFRSWALA